MEKNEKKYLKMIFVLLGIAFIVPSIIYLITGNTIFNLKSSFSFFYTEPTINFTFPKIAGTIAFFMIFGGIWVTYYFILKNHKKVFSNIKDIIKFVVIISFIFLIMLPVTSTDVFYYIGTGWSEAEYDVNPYYTSVKEVIDSNEKAKNDEMLLKMQGVWENQTIVYGPIWPFVCKILSALSFGNLGLALYIYKIFNLILHLANAYIIYKLARKKVLYSLMYALNPLALFEGLVNVHNEILVIFFILLGLYLFLRKKKTWIAIVFFGLATAIKYYAVLLLPFLILYKYRKQKTLKKLLYSLGWAILFIIVLVICYMLYMRDLDVLKGIVTQQNKIANSIYILLAVKDIELAFTVSKGITLAFIIIYVATIIKIIFSKKQYTFSKLINEYQFLLILFIFATITNLQSWYSLWLLPTLPWLKARNVKLNICITAMAGIANIVYFIFNEHYIFGQYYILLFIIGVIILNIKQIIPTKQIKHINLK